jgi:hypothetical protein
MKNVDPNFKKSMERAQELANRTGKEILIFKNAIGGFDLKVAGTVDVSCYWEAVASAFPQGVYIPDKPKIWSKPFLIICAVVWTLIGLSVVVHWVTK